MALLPPPAPLGMCALPPLRAEAVPGAAVSSAALSGVRGRAPAAGPAPARSIVKRDLHRACSPRAHRTGAEPIYSRQAPPRYRLPYTYSQNFNQSGAGHQNHSLCHACGWIYLDINLIKFFRSTFIVHSRGHAAHG